MLTIAAMELSLLKFYNILKKNATRSSWVEVLPVPGSFNFYFLF